MLNLFRRHGVECGTKGPDGKGANAGKRSIKRKGKGFCPTKPPCWIYFEGIDGAGKQNKAQVLLDPQTGQKVRDWSRANEIIREMETPAPPEPGKAPTLVPLREAVREW